MSIYSDLSSSEEKPTPSKGGSIYGDLSKEKSLFDSVRSYFSGDTEKPKPVNGTGVAPVEPQPTTPNVKQLLDTTRQLANQELAEAQSKPVTGSLGKALSRIQPVTMTMDDLAGVSELDISQRPPVGHGATREFLPSEPGIRTLRDKDDRTAYGTDELTPQQRAKATNVIALQDVLTDKKNVAEGQELTKRHKELDDEVAKIGESKKDIEAKSSDLKKLKTLKAKVDSFKVDKTDRNSVNQYNDLVKSYNSQLKNVKDYNDLVEKHNKKLEDLRLKTDAFNEQAGKYSPKGVPPLSEIDKNYDVLTQQLGIRGDLTNKEFVDMLMTAAIAQGIYTAPLKTVGWVGAYMAWKEAESAGTQKLRGEDYKFGAGRELQEVLGPLKQPYATIAELVEFFGPAGASGRAMESITPKLQAKVTPLVNKYFRNIATDIKPDATYTLDKDRLRDFFAMGGEGTSEEEKALYEILKTSDIPTKELKEVFSGRATIDVNVPGSTIKSVEDKKAWAKVKGFFRINEPVENIIGKEWNSLTEDEQNIIKKVHETTRGYLGPDPVDFEVVTKGRATPTYELRPKATESPVAEPEPGVKAEEVEKEESAPEPVAEKKVEEPAVVEPEPAEASVKMMITKAEKEALKAKGYTDEQINDLKPEDAARIIKGEEPEERGSGELPAETGFAPALRPAVQYQGKVYEGEVGGSHPGVMKDNDIEPGAEHLRGYVDPDGNYLDRKQAEKWLKKNDPATYAKWKEESEGELHSKELAKAKEKAEKEALAKAKEAEDVPITEGQKSESDKREHPERDSGRDESGSGSSDSLTEGGEVKKEEEKAGEGGVTFDKRGYASESSALKAIKNRKLKIADYDIAERDGRYFVEAKKATESPALATDQKAVEKTPESAAPPTGETEVVEPGATSGGKFKTGEPVSFGYIHNTEKSPKMGSRFGQDIEPAGRYIQEKPSTFKGEDFPNMVEGTTNFNNPLVIDWGGGYQEATNWKRVLSNQYGGKTGKKLSDAIRKDGHDGIITLDKNGNASEVVDLKAEGKGIAQPGATSGGGVDENTFVVETAYHGTSSLHAKGIRSKGFLPPDKHGMPTATVQPNGISLTIDPKVAKPFSEAVSNFTKGSKPEVLEVDASKLKIFNDPNEDWAGHNNFDDFITDIKKKGYDAVRTDTGESEIYVFNIGKLKLKDSAPAKGKEPDIPARMEGGEVGDKAVIEGNRVKPAWDKLTPENKETFKGQNKYVAEVIDDLITNARQKWRDENTGKGAPITDARIDEMFGPKGKFGKTDAGEKIIIEVPNDGEYSVNNDLSSLLAFKDNFKGVNYKAPPAFRGQGLPSTKPTGKATDLITKEAEEEHQKYLDDRESARKSYEYYAGESLEKANQNIDEWEKILKDVNDKKITLKSLADKFGNKAPSHNDVRQKLRDANEELLRYRKHADEAKEGIKNQYPSLYKEMFDKAPVTRTEKLGIDDVKRYPKEGKDGRGHTDTATGLSTRTPNKEGDGGIDRSDQHERSEVKEMKSGDAVAVVAAKKEADQKTKRGTEVESETSEKEPYRLEEATGNVDPRLSREITDRRRVEKVATTISKAIGREIAPEDLRLWERTNVDDLGKLGGVFQKKVVVFQVQGEGVPEMPGFFFPPDSTSIYINASAKDPHLAILGHEMLHALRRDAPDIYDGFVEHVQATEYFNERKPLYDQTYGREITSDEAIEEYAADYIGAQFTHQDFFDDLVGRKPGIFRRIYDAIIRLLDELEGLVFKTDIFFRDFKKAKRAAVKTMADYADRMRGYFKPKETAGEVKYMTPHVPELGRDVFADKAMTKEAEGLKWETPKGDVNIYSIHKKTGKSYSQLIMEKAAQDPESFAKGAPNIFKEISKLAKDNKKIAEAIEIPEMRTTGIKKAVIEEERAERGYGQIEVDLQKALGESYEKGKAAVLGGDRDPRVMAAELTKKSFPKMDDEEVGMLVFDRMRLQNDHEATMKTIKDAQRDGDKALEVELKLKLAKLEDDLVNNDEAGRRAGRQSGRTLSAFRMLAAEDYSFARMVARAGAKLGDKPIPEEWRKEVEQLTIELKAAQDRLNKYDEEAAQRAADQAIKDLKRDEVIQRHLGQSKERKSAIRGELQAEWSSLAKELNQILAPTQLNFMFDPAALKVLGRMVKNAVMSGINSAEGIVNNIYEEIVAEFPDTDITKRDIRDAISGYGKKSEPSRDEIETQLREARRQMRLISAYEDALAGPPGPKKSGFQPDPQSDEVRRLTKEVKQAMRESGIDSTSMRSPEDRWKSSLDAVKTRLSNHIADLEKQIETGEKSPKKVGIKYDEEATALKAERDRLKAIVTDMEGKPEMSPEQKIRMATAAVEKSIAEYERRISEKDLTPQKRKGTTPETPELKALRAKRDSLKEVYKDMQDEAKPKKTPDEIALQTWKTRVKNNNAKLEKQLEEITKSGKRPIKIPKRTVILDPAAMTLQADEQRIKNKLNNKLHEIDRMNRTTPEKWMEYGVKWRRNIVLSSVTTLAKLTVATTARELTTPTEEMIGEVLKHIPGLREIMDAAPREGGGFNVDAEVDAFLTFFRKMTYADAVETAKTGKGELDLLYGKKGDFPPEVLDFFAHIHAGIKTPLKRSEYFRALKMLSTWAVNHGYDISNPMVQMHLGVKAYESAQRAILMNPNAVSDLYQGIIHALERRGMGGKVASTLMRMELPIVRVPTNLALETLNYQFGLPKAAIQLTYLFATNGGSKGGVEYLKQNPDVADGIARSLKKGTLGAALLLIGWMYYENFGGFYQQGEKRKATDVKAGHVRVGETDLPAVLSHNPVMWAFQTGSTMHRVYNHLTDSLKGGPASAAYEGTIAATKGVLSQVPFFEEPYRMQQTFRSADTMAKKAAEFATSLIVPPDVGNVARLMDKEEGEPVRRKPESAADMFKLQIPVLREEVPRNVKAEAKAAKEKAVEGDAWKMLDQAGKDHKINEAEKSAIRNTADGDPAETEKLINLVSRAKHIEVNELLKAYSKHATLEEKRILRPILTRRMNSKAGQVSEKLKEEYFDILRQEVEE